MTISADEGTSVTALSPRVAVDHSLIRVSFRRATLLSRAATSDGSSLIGKPESPAIGSTASTRAVKVLGSMPLVATSNSDHMLCGPSAPVQDTSYRPWPMGTKGAVYVQLKSPVASALPASVFGGPSPKIPASTLIATSQLSADVLEVSRRSANDDGSGTGAPWLSSRIDRRSPSPGADAGAAQPQADKPSEGEPKTLTSPRLW